MDDGKEYLVCDNCNNKNFIRIYNFALCSKMVNFSDEVISDHVSEEFYQCTNCKKMFTKQQIVSRLREMEAEKLRSSGTDGQ
ncbi:MAG: hypothetical protein ACOC6B_01625 [Thermodesulfobacteriota bacterium]